MSASSAGNRWVCLAGGTAMIVCAGAVYGFGSIAEEMRDHLQLTAYDQGFLAMCGNVGLWIGSFTGGIVADARGPRVAMLGGAAFFLVGYGGIWLLLRSGVTAADHGRQVAYLVSALWLAAGLGSGWVYNATIFTNSANFGLAARPKVIGLLATLFGASSTIWSTVLNGCVGGHPHRGAPPPPITAGTYALSVPVVYDDSLDEELLAAVDFGDSSAAGGSAGGGGEPGDYTCVGGWVNGGIVSYFFLLAVALPPLTVLGALSSFRITDASERNRADRADGEPSIISRRLNVSSAGVLIVLVAVGASSVLVVAADGDEAAIWIRMAAPIVILALVFALVLSIILLRPRPTTNDRWPGGGYPSSPSRPLLAAGADEPEELAEGVVVGGGKVLEHTPHSALRSAEFWLMWLVMTTVCGSNASTMNILSLIFTDRHSGSAVVARVASILVMVVSSLTRFICGLLIAAAPLRPTPTLLVCGAAAMASIGQLLFALDSEVLLFAACVALGVSDGLFWGSLPVVSNRVFGLRNSGGIYGMLVCFGAVGFITLSLGVQPAVYDRHAKDAAAGAAAAAGGGASSSDHHCEEGVLCFRAYHLVCACFGAVGFAASVALIVTVMRRKRQLQEPATRYGALSTAIER
jgi:MFS family permease